MRLKTLLAAPAPAERCNGCPSKPLKLAGILCPECDFARCTECGETVNLLNWARCYHCGAKPRVVTQL